MPKDALTRLEARRKTIIQEMHSLVDGAAADGNRSHFTETEDREWDSLNDDLKRVTQRMEEIVNHEAREADLADQRAPYEGAIRGHDDGQRRYSDDDSHDLQRSIRRWLRGQMPDSQEFVSRTLNFSIAAKDKEFRTLSKLTGAAGGNTVATSFAPRLYEHMTTHAQIRRTNVTVWTTQNGQAFQIPRTTAHGGAALVAEAGTIGASDPTIGQLTLDAYKYGVLIQVSNELITDTSVDLLSYLAKQAGAALGDASGAHFITGDGSSKPNGVVTAATVGKTAAATTAITADELVDLYHSVAAPYRVNGTWLMGDTTFQSLRKLKTGLSGDNQYLWERSLSAGDPLTLLGRPVIIEPNMPAATAGLKPVLFGDLSGYHIRDVENIRFERSDDFAFSSDLASFRALLRTDGDLVDVNAVKTLQMAAA